MGAAALLLTSCGALAWLAEPVGGSTIPPGQAPASVAPRAPGRACACLDNPSEPEPAQPAPGPSRGSVIVRGAAAVGGTLTGAPVAWTLAGQLAHVLLGAVAGRRRKIPTGQPAPS